MNRLIVFAAICLTASCGSSRDCPNGTTRQQSTYESVSENWCADELGRRHGFYEQNSPGTRVRGQYRAGLKHGVWEQDDLRSVFTGWYRMHDGTGIEISWYPGGHKQREQEFVGGVPHGAATEWFENRETKSIEYYRNGEKNGRWTLYHSNGREKSLQIYDEGRLIEHRQWDSDGTEIESLP